MKTYLRRSFSDIISAQNLLLAWHEFACGKGNKKDVRMFELRLMDNILALRDDLAHHTYRHDRYQEFHIADPKPRTIHKATVRDRLLHHAIYRILYPFFDRAFISDAFSCRNNKGTHKALNRFRAFGRMVSKSSTKTCWVLKCDIRKFFTSINHTVLMDILRQYIPDERILWLIRQVIGSFSSTAQGVGLPLGNLTSQLFANIYMNVFDQFAKHKLKAKYYIRYTDDFVFMSTDKTHLERILPTIDAFLCERLKLNLHPDKVFIKTLASGMDFLGWVHFPDHRVLRTATKRRMFRRIREHPTEGTLQSYLGLLSHGNAHELSQKLM